MLDSIAPQEHLQKEISLLCIMRKSQCAPVRFFHPKASGVFTLRRVLSQFTCLSLGDCKIFFCHEEREVLLITYQHLFGLNFLRKACFAESMIGTMKSTLLLYFLLSALFSEQMFNFCVCRKVNNLKINRENVTNM